ncbi:MAG: nitroreductase family protein [Candidatus Cloacimonetes bacterium]|nr:nitroreductase family protein [Candidatus Cloacimonadota bacterium]
MDNSTLATIKARHSIRLFKDKQVSAAVLMEILEAANKAPSAHNQQSWKFIVLLREKKDQLGDLVNEHADDFPRPSSTLLRMAARSIHSAPVVIAVANTGELIKNGTKLYKVEQQEARDFFRIMEIQSSAAAVENMLLAATSLGLGSVWLGIICLLKDKVLNFLEEDAGEFVAVIPMGYPQKDTRGPRKKTLDEIVKIIE